MNWLLVALVAFSVDGCAKPPPPGVSFWFVPIMPDGVSSGTAQTVEAVLVDFTENMVLNDGKILVVTLKSMEPEQAVFWLTLGDGSLMEVVVKKKETRIVLPKSGKGVGIQIHVTDIVMPPPQK